MTKAHLLAGLVGAGTFALAVALEPGEPRQLSIELWVMGVTIWMAGLILVALTKTAPLVRPRVRHRWFRTRRPGLPMDRRPSDLIATEGLVVNALEDERSMTRRLQPRLRDLTEHLLRTNHGVDAARHPSRAAAVLADVGWVVGHGRAPDRSPTPSEIDRLLDVVLVDDDPRNSADAERGPQ